MDVELNIRFLIQVRILKHPRIKKIRNLSYLARGMHYRHLINYAIWLLIGRDIVRIKLTAARQLLILAYRFLQTRAIRSHRHIIRACLILIFLSS